MAETVLIVDDSLTVRMDLAEAFESAGFRALPVETAAGARDALAKAAVEVVILDVLLPDGDGVELLREIRGQEFGERIAILMLSTEAEVKDRVRALKVGADEYVGKPYDTSYVVAKARELARLRRSASAPAKSAVLIIDDSVTFRERLKGAFEDAGYEVLTAANGEDGLKIAADRRPSAIVVDGVMPGIDGATVIRRVRLDAALRGVPCLLLTASEDRDAELKAFDAGADAFVRKEEDVDLVLAKLGAALRMADAGPRSDTVSLLGPRKILAVDDSLTFLNELNTSLRGEGYDVVLAHSGEEALVLLGVQRVDCILLDLVMPGLGGQETCRRIKSAPVVRDIPLIILTARDDRRAMLEGLGVGADDYISKTNEFDVLKARLRAQIRRKQFEDENRRIRERLLRNELEATEARAARELAETRAALVEELERKNRELEAFSYSVSHDLRAPLRGIDGFSQVLLEDYADKLDATGRDYLNRVRTGAQRMGELIDDMLELSRVGRGELRRERVDVSALAREIAMQLKFNDPLRTSEIKVAPELGAEADRGLLKIVLENLLGNAWKFTSKADSAKIEFSATLLPEGQAFFVRDNGAGFSMSYAEKLFRPFQRLHTNTDFPGTGIGLATVFRAIDRHGGRIWAESAVGEGATFFFTLSKGQEAGSDRQFHHLARRRQSR